ncbi:hypothetical protein MMC32_000269 [Xylographa parallela]|nr:hypothetical protein [Xylographa parallela]
MELRRRVVPPKRYEPELSDGERYMPTVRKALFRPPYVEFNPHLPPAAFPTLDDPVQTLSEVDLGTELGQTCQQLLQTQSESEAQGLRSSQQRPLSGHPPSTPCVAMENHIWNAGIYPHSPAYYQNLASVHSGLSQEEYERNMKEMETSDEDENNGQRKSAFLKRPSLVQTRAPQWKRLAPIHRIEIIQSLLAEGKTEEQATGALGLSAEEWLETVAWDRHRRKVESKEDSRITTMQSEVNSLLLDRDGMGFTSINSTTYQALLSHHLAAFTTGKMDFSTTSTRDLVHAQSFLRSRRLPLSLVGQWVEPYVGIPTEAEERGSHMTLGLGEGQEHDTIDRMGQEHVRQEHVRQEHVRQEHVRQDVAKLKVMNTSREELSATNGRAPVRRKYVHLDDETPSAHPKAILTGQALEKTSSNVPFLKLNSPSPHQPHQLRRPDSIITNNKLIAMQEIMQPPLKLDVVTQNTSLAFHNSARSTSLPISRAIIPTDTMKDFDSTTIVVQPKRTWSGTAKPGRSTFFPNATLRTPVADSSIHKMWKTTSGNLGVSTQSSEALERLRIESMKYSGKPLAGFPELAKVNNASTPTDVQNAVKARNPKQLAVSDPKVPSTAPKQRVRKASNTSSTTRSSIATAITPSATPKDRSTPATPDLPISGSSTRSLMATRKPSRYRDGLTNAASPTDTVAGNRASKQQAIAMRTETNGLFSSVYELSKHKAAALKTEDMPDHPDLAPGRDTIRRPSLGLPEKKQAGSRQSVQPVPSPLISADSRNGSRRNPMVENVGSVTSSIEVTKNIVPKSGGKTPRKAPSKPLISAALDAGKTAVSKVGGKAPRKAPSKPPSSAGKAPRKTPSKPLPSELLAAEDHHSGTARETAEAKVVKANAKRSKTMI